MGAGISVRCASERPPYGWHPAMSRTSLLTSALAVLALGAGRWAMQLRGRERRRDAPRASGCDRAVPSRKRPRPADRRSRSPARARRRPAAGRGWRAGRRACASRRAAACRAGRALAWREVGPGARALERLSVRSGPGERLVVERQGDGFVRRDDRRGGGPDPGPDPPRSRRRLAPAWSRPGCRARCATRCWTGGRSSDSPRSTSSSRMKRPHPARATARRCIWVCIWPTGSIRRWVGEGGHLRPLGRDEEARDRAAAPAAGAGHVQPGTALPPDPALPALAPGTDFASPAGTPVQARSAGG
jgi:hypothetical protein